ncbi:hypothetical protein Heshes_22590 [Alicyclobacillus hesperidum]|uniref:Uncharacterized conserved protein YlxW, UPF0749 family n=1 Tax=Alicyclobacillus hesperidum TaxID=89784 RepID=A0A1H2UYY1_9BACL|nr:DUF881 domain-containing protein [Alicyclobacillus hesperidum]GLV14575.1 hypothetical protein Heshes_22590 [Alicyclobacillus hesperidum]SDW61275.1 Uncharacterized conserved protein YlxW, UPF0749 family [Alicyclobacillus hesperidum]
MKRRSLVWGATATATALGFMLTVQLTSQNSFGQQSTSYIDLRTQVQEQAQEHLLLEQQVSKLNAQLAEYRAASGSASELREVLQKDEKSLEQQAGILPTSGPGITITIQPDAKLGANPAQMALFPQQADQWLDEVVNVLLGNGATAISINDQRLVATSAIRLVEVDGIGGVHVNGHPITTPYVIRAVGNIQDMQAALTVEVLQGYFEAMGEDFIVRSYPQKDGVTVPGYSGPLPGQYAKEGNG